MESGGGKDKKGIILLFVFCVLAGMFFAVQAGVSQGQRLYVSAKAVDDYKTAIEGEREMVFKIGKNQEEVREKLIDLSRTQDEEEAIKKLHADLAKEVKLYGMYSGTREVQGQGVEITVDDSVRKLNEWEDINNVIVHDIDILLIINQLAGSGAEAISINGQRYTDRTSIICSGYTVEINGERYARPFVIKAIGDGKRMTAALIGSGGYGASLKAWGIVFKIEVKENIVIPAYEGGRSQKYVTKVKGGRVN